MVNGHQVSETEKLQKKLLRPSDFLLTEIDLPHSPAITTNQHSVVLAPWTNPIPFSVQYTPRILVLNFCLPSNGHRGHMSGWPQISALQRDAPDRIARPSIGIALLTGTSGPSLQIQSQQRRQAVPY